MTGETIHAFKPKQTLIDAVGNMATNVIKEAGILSAQGEEKKVGEKIQTAKIIRSLADQLQIDRKKIDRKKSGW